MSPLLRILISYRRMDAAADASLLYDVLRRRYGEESVLMDVDQGDPGDDLSQVVERAVGVSDVVIALIGPDWLSASDTEGRRRIDMPGDVVRLEIEAALRSNALFIPTLVRRAEMPSPDELPESLQGLVRRHAFEWSDKRELDRLINSLIGIVEDSRVASVGETLPAAKRDEASHSRWHWFRPPRVRKQKESGEEEVSEIEREVDEP